MKKIRVLLLTILLTPFLAGLYGILHDQLTYTICHEYFTKFKFIQFHVYSAHIPERVGAIIVGWGATWWTGIFIGMGQGLTGLIHSDSKPMFKAIYKATLITLYTALLAGLVGFIFGKIYYSYHEVTWIHSSDIVDRQNIAVVGLIHLFSYMGGFIGLITGIIYQVREKRRTKPILDSI